MSDSAEGQGNSKPPTALRAVRLLNRFTIRLGAGAMGVVILLLALMLLRLPAVAIAITVVLLAVLFVLTCLSFLAWFLIVTFCYARFSLGIFLSFSILLSTALLLLIGFEGEYVELGTFLLIATLSGAIGVIHQFEPKG